ncbi:hypothetical protein F8388_018523 [Cannabis sativa]|uniref:DUF4283 domain-containing protein n=1 Tax=Cannabis sativa TaxID=3483 RepID=A0A7J6G549_CANSA|nr:hypothetical protein F8388_018523 [Cannabis sativa]
MTLVNYPLFHLFPFQCLISSCTTFSMLCSEARYKYHNSLYDLYLRFLFSFSFSDICMESILEDMNSTLCLSEKERNVHSLSESDLHDPNQPPKFFLVARCLSNTVNPKTFIKKIGEFWSNKCRDKQRISSGEPWNFFNQLILLHFPTSLQNVSKEDFQFAEFWVQTHRLPFLSKSRALAKKVGEWVGEFIEVYEDSFHEGWGSLLRIRVRLDVSQPLMCGKMVSLPRVMDEHWLEFRYENLLIGHPFDKCIAFMELVDMGVDPDLLYGPQIIGDKLPISGYDRYRTDFSKANAYPFLTRLARKTITSSIPTAFNNKNLTLGSLPQPRSLTSAELAHKNQPESSTKVKCPELPLPFPSYVPSNEATIFIKTYKRQVDLDNLRSVLKRCRNNKKEESSADDNSSQYVSDMHSDYAEGGIIPY